MEMRALRELHRSMRRIGADIQTFQIKTGIAEFECLFSTREDPFILALTSRGDRYIFLEIPVHPGYRVKTFLGDNYGKLLSVLYEDGRSRNSFKPGDWFKDVNEQIPKQARKDKIPNNKKTLRLRPNLEEIDRPYFDTWILWKDGKTRPSLENKRKTLALLGRKALDFSEKCNMSSRWSAVDTGRQWEESARTTGVHLALGTA